MILYLAIFLFAIQSLYAQEKPKSFVREKKSAYGEFSDPVTVIEKGYMVNGFIEGECRGYLKAKKSVLIYIAHYKHGLLQGQYIQYYPNGRLFAVDMFDKGVLINWVYYDTSGVFCKMEVYDRDSGDILLPLLSITSDKSTSDFYFNDSITYVYDTLERKFVRSKY